MVVVVVLLLVLNDPADTSGPGPALQPPSAVTTTTSTSPSARPTRTAPVAEPPATAKPRVRKVPVTVLNNSRRTGLATRAADQLRAKGWPIRLVGNYRGRLPVSTLYYLPGGRAVADLLAKQFPAVRRVLPRPDGLPGRGLTLVVTREWPA